ncbi:Rsu1 [Phodopus roborovskii]|uniref:Rsu1 protein n=1 Tax=Phodopus roborovskii TaxID=109678 RepID=A0AAV0A5A6_PHORO|nr:Rsu1 [Phodopus roborovskii]
MSKSLKKLVEESREKNQPEVDMSDRGISSMLDVNGLWNLAHLCPAHPLVPLAS